MMNEDLKALLSRLSEPVWLQRFSEVLNHPNIKKHGLIHSRAEIPACSSHKLLSQEYAECVARNMPLTVYHPTTTCRMGPNATDNVVDSKLSNFSDLIEFGSLYRVYGAKNLRVIDASIMPHVTSGNTNAPSIMIGERGVDFIKKEHGL